MNAARSDRLVGITLLAIALIWSGLVYWTIPAGEGGYVGPRAFPLFLGLVLSGLSAVLLFRSFLPKPGMRPAEAGEDAQIFVTRQEVRLTGGVFLVIIGYGFLLEKLGFALATPIVIVVTLAGVLGLRRPLLIAAIAMGVTAGCWAIFGKLLGVYLPHGSWASIG
jgi:hypothetical protein